MANLLTYGNWIKTAEGNYLNAATGATLATQEHQHEGWYPHGGTVQLDVLGGPFATEDECQAASDIAVTANFDMLVFED